MEGIDLLKERILDKKELRSLDGEFVDKILREESNWNKKLYEKLKSKDFNPRSAEFGEFQKIVRRRLRKFYGVFSTETLSPEKKQRLLDDFRIAVKQKKTRDKDEIIKKILSSHLSTKERIPHYKEFYEIIESLKPKSILDLGCGLNPISLEHSKRKYDYTASDISQESLDFIKEYFEIKNINGKTVKADLTNEQDLMNISEASKQADITLMLKLVDTIEAIKKGSTRKLLDKIHSKNIIISVPNQTISGKNKIRSERKWLDEITKKYIKKHMILGPEKYVVLERQTH